MCPLHASLLLSLNNAMHAPAQVVEGEVAFTDFLLFAGAFGTRRDSFAQAEQWQFLREESSTTVDYNSFTRFGSYTMLVYTLDSNYGDFLVSSQQDPRLLDEPRFSVQGGVGLLASMAPDSIIYQVVDAEP